MNLFVLAWRVAVLAALIWVGFELHSINRRMPTGTDYETEQQLRAIAIDVEQINKTLILLEKTHRK